jgi:hypothetical protein
MHLFNLVSVGVWTEVGLVRSHVTSTGRQSNANGRGCWLFFTGDCVVNGSMFCFLFIYCRGNTLELFACDVTCDTKHALST